MERFERMTWWLAYHLVWTTKHRAALIDEERGAEIAEAIRIACAEIGGEAFATFAMPDHVHVVATAPPAVSIEHLVGVLKDASRSWLERRMNVDDPGLFDWQADYGAMTVGEDDLADVVSYVNEQPERHARKDIWPMFEITEPPFP